MHRFRKNTHDRGVSFKHVSFRFSPVFPVLSINASLFPFYVNPFLFSESTWRPISKELSMANVTSKFDLIFLNASFHLLLINSFGKYFIAF